MNAFFVGIGGMGMSGLARILHESGHKVAGSDRNLDGEYCRQLKKLGIKIYSQNGQGPEEFMKDHNLTESDFNIVKSTAVEDHVPDIVTARKLELKQIMRSDLLAKMFNQKKGLAIGGTAGKTTTTGLIAWILKFAGIDPSCAVGGIISGLNTNALRGKGEHFIIEADESDGSIVKYRPWASVVTNISRDHKSPEELLELFRTFLDNTAENGLKLVCGQDQLAKELTLLSKNPIQTYGFSSDCDYIATGVSIDNDQASFIFENTKFELKMPGEHNVLNALAAIVLCRQTGLELDQIAEAIKAFPGMKRRFEKVGMVDGVTVIDDFAHNPVEIEAAIKTARKSSRRRFIVYQPHGFGPARFTRDDLVKVFSNLQADEFLFLDKIFYAGGTVNKDISSNEIIKEVQQKFSQAYNIEDRNELVNHISSKAISGDMVLVMGARDINKICPEIICQLKNRKNQTAA
ncbi:MAG: UDP-N-acetylmuramate--L-alanine ligase [Candidatus Rifleibacteriota bacterium]